MGSFNNWLVETDDNQPQRTIAQEVVLEGRGGFTNEPAKVVLCPDDPGTGVRFKRAGLNDKVQAALMFLLPRENAPYKTTSLHRGDLVFQTVEHLLSAIYGLGIDNVLVVTEVNGLLPFFDGSSEEYTKNLLRAGIQQQSGTKKRLLTVEESQEFKISGKDGYIRLSRPSQHGILEINAHIIYDKPIGIQNCSYGHSSRLYCLEIARARTFQHKFFKNTQATKRKFPGFWLSQITTTRGGGLIQS